MIEQVLSARNVGLRVKLTAKAVISVVLVALAVALPQFVHIAAGASGGAKWLPMYLPVLLGGCLLGAWWGMGIGAVSPLISFALTSLAGEGMPAAARLPFMVAELVSFGAVSGAFSKHIAVRPWLAFPAAVSAVIAGRGAFIALAAVFGAVSPISVSVAWAQVQAGLAGAVMLVTVVPAVVIIVSLLTRRESK